MWVPTMFFYDKKETGVQTGPKQTHCETKRPLRIPNQLITSGHVFTCTTRCHQLSRSDISSMFPHRCLSGLHALQDHFCCSHPPPPPAHPKTQNRRGNEVRRRLQKSPAAVQTEGSTSLAHLRAWFRCWCHPAERDSLCCSTDGFYGTAADCCREHAHICQDWKCLVSTITANKRSKI